MKKFILALTCIVLVFVFTACNAGKTNDEKAENPKTDDVVTEQPVGSDEDEIKQPADNVKVIQPIQNGGNYKFD